MGHVPSPNPNNPGLLSISPKPHFHDLEVNASGTLSIPRVDSLVGGLIQPIWKICSSNLDHFPRDRGENLKKNETTT